MSNFDDIWQHVPEFSARQLLLTVVTGMVALQTGLVEMYPIFAGYEPNHKCVDGILEGEFSDPLINKTIVAEYNWVCDKTNYRNLFFAANGIGMAIGCLISGPLTENYGRKFSMIFLSYVSVAALAFLWISENLFIVLFARIVTMVASEIKYLAYSTYVIEVVGPNWRALTGTLTHLYYASGCVLCSVLSYWFREWRNLTLATLIVNLPLIFLSHLIPESPMWLFANGKDAENDFKKLTGKTKGLGRKYFIAKKSENNNADNVSDNLSDIFIHPVLRVTTILQSLLFFTIAMVYFGISFNAAELPVNIWMANGMNGALDGISQFFIIPSLDRVGRRLVLGVCLLFAGVLYFITGLTSFGSGPVDNENIRWQHTVALFCSLGSKFFISGAFSAIYTYVAELYPTSVRTFGLSIGSLGAALGTFLAPFVLSSETKGRKLPDRIQDKQNHDYVELENISDSEEDILSNDA